MYITDIIIFAVVMQKYIKLYQTAKFTLPKLRVASSNLVSRSLITRELD